jgi:hypothetical protein
MPQGRGWRQSEGHCGPRRTEYLQGHDMGAVSRQTELIQRPADEEYPRADGCSRMSSPFTADADLALGRQCVSADVYGRVTARRLEDGTGH